MALVVGCLEGELSSVKMIIGEVIATEIVEERCALSSRVKRKGRRLLVYQGKDLFGASKLPAMKEEFKTNIGHEVDSYSSAVWPTVAV